MPTEQVVVELVKSLGAPGALALLLWMLLKQQTEERRQVTSQYLATLESTIRATAESTTQVTSSMNALTTALQTSATQSAAEHRQLLDSIVRTHRVWEQIQQGEVPSVSTLREKDPR